MKSLNKDFFISYSKPDRSWAEWIAWTLEENGYSVIIQAWDFRPGGNFVLDMQRAISESRRVIMVLSDSYLASAYAQSEWAAAFTQDPDSRSRKLLPVKVKPCDLPGLLSALHYVDLVRKSEIEARHLLLSALLDRQKPETCPHFPQPLPESERMTSGNVPFPGVIKALSALPLLFLSPLPDWEDSSDPSEDQSREGNNYATNNVPNQVDREHNSEISLDVEKDNLSNSLEEVLESIVDKYDLDSLAINRTVQIDRYESITIEDERNDDGDYETVSLEDEEHKTIFIDSDHDDDSQDDYNEDSQDDYDDYDAFV